MRDWLYVEDHARALEPDRDAGAWARATTSAGAPNAPTWTWSRLSATCSTQKRPRGGGRSYRELIRFVADRPGHDRRYAIDPSKIESELGWSAEETFESGLAKTIDWYLDNDWWWRPIREGSYAGERLGIAS